MTSSATYRFNLFTISAGVHDTDPSLTEAEIAAAYDTLMARGNLSNPSPPLTRVETLIRDCHCAPSGRAASRAGTLGLRWR